MTEPVTRKVNAHSNLGTLQEGDVVLGERTSGTTGLLTVPALGGVSDGDKGDITVSASGATWTIDTPTVATVATDDKVLIKDTSNLDATRYVTAQSIADLAAGGVTSVNGETGAVTLTSDDISTAAQTNKFVTAADITKLGNLSGTNTGDQTISLTGDVTGSGTGSFAATIANDAVTYAKMQNVSATDKLLGRSTAGAGDVEEIACTAAGRAILDDADASAQRTTLGLGTLATQSGTFSGTSSGTNTGDQNLFQTISVSGQSDVVADSTTDTLTLAAGSGVTITTDATTDTITIAASGSGDVVGPASATDNAAARFDSTTGKLIQNSLLIIADTTGNISGFEQATASKNMVVGGNSTAAGYIDFLEDTDNGSNKITITAPSSISSDTTLTLPNVTGTLRIDRSTAFYAKRTTTTQSLANATYTKIQLNGEDFDSGSYFDSTTNYRYTPLVAGKYFITVMLTLAGNTVDQKQIVAYIVKNGTNIVQSVLTASVTSGYGCAIANVVVDMNGSTDYLEMYGYQDAGSAKNIGFGEGETFMAGALIE